MFTAVLVTVAVGASPSAGQLELLKTFRDEFISISPGKGKYPKSFVMGRAAGGQDNERPIRTVTFNYNFEVAKYEVPQNLWESVMGTNPSKWKGLRNSVEMLSFDEAQEFCQRSTALLRAAGVIKSNQVVRLPSEAEWEYVARAATSSIYSFGDSEAMLGQHGWYKGNAAGNDPPVGAKNPNPWGLYDIHGYLWEWCTDTTHASYDSAPTDGSAWIDSGNGDQRVLRGGSWEDGAEKLTCSYRRAARKDFRDDGVGLRCVLATGAVDSRN